MVRCERSEGDEVPHSVAGIEFAPLGDREQLASFIDTAMQGGDRA